MRTSAARCVIVLGQVVLGLLVLAGCAQAPSGPPEKPASRPAGDLVQECRGSQDPCATRGLAGLTVNPPPSATSGLIPFGADWSNFVRVYVAPLTAPALAAVALFVGLMVTARLLARFAVRPDDVVWPDRVRRCGFGAGIFLSVVAACAPAVAAVVTFRLHRLPPPSRPLQRRRSSAE